MNILLHWILSAVSIGVAAYLVPTAYVTTQGALIAAVVLGALNLFIRPVLIILTLPINIVTLGLFSLVINAVLVMMASVVVPGFTVDGFWSALMFAIVLTLIHWVFSAWNNSANV